MDEQIVRTIDQLTMYYATVNFKDLSTHPDNTDFTALLTYVSRLSDLNKQRTCLLARLAILEAREI